MKGGLLIPVEEKYQMNSIWILWEALIYESKEKSDLLYHKIIVALLNLFCIKYIPTCNKRRKYILYSAIEFLTENINFDTPLIENKKLIENISNKISILYKEVKKNEIAPQTDYLFFDTEKNNIDKTIEKLEIMENINISI